MPAVVLIVRDILLLRRGPQDLPYSTQLLLASAALCVLAQLPLAPAREASFGAVFAAALLQVAFVLGGLYLMLVLRNKRNRFVQSGSALLACLFVFSLLSLPIALYVGELPASPDQMSGLQLLLGVVSLPLLLWKIAVDAHIFRHSLDISFGAGLIIAVFWIIVGVALSGAGGAAA